MKIEEIRPSFTIYCIGSQQDRLGSVTKALGAAGYMVANFAELSSAFSEVYSNPPHFILLDLAEERFNLAKAIKQIASQLPESHVFLISDISKRNEAVGFLENGISDIIFTPLASPIEVVRSLDRSAERDYLMYLNERLSQEPVIAKVESGFSSDESSINFMRELFAQKTVDDCISVFMQTVSTHYGSSPAVYFKYFANRRVLVADKGFGVQESMSGIGVNFNELNPSFRVGQLRNPMSLSEISDVMREVFHASNFFAMPIDVLGEVLGIVCFMMPEPQEQVLASIKDWQLLLNKALCLLELEKRFHVMCVKDPSTDLYTRNIFIEKIREEISRARRTHLPVSLLLVAVDQYGQLINEVGHEEAQTLLKMIAKIFERHSRVNDVIGRTGADEFGMLLPHTGHAGALVKAERLRKIIESADFSKVVKSFPKISVSLGISEYPTMVRDAEEFLQAADEALFQVRKLGNQTSMASAPEGFVADF